MYGIFTYIWLIFMVNLGEYTIHGSYGIFIKQIRERYLGEAENPYEICLEQ